VFVITTCFKRIDSEIPTLYFTFTEICTSFTHGSSLCSHYRHHLDWIPQPLQLKFAKSDLTILSLTEGTRLKAKQSIIITSVLSWKSVGCIIHEASAWVKVRFEDNEHAFIVSLSLWLLEHALQIINGCKSLDNTMVVTFLYTCGA